MNDLYNKLTQWEDEMNNEIDKLIEQRKVSADAAALRYVTKKLEICIGALHRAQDKISYKMIEFKLDGDGK